MNPQGQYTGPERCKIERRQNNDRREEIRFEMSKTPRRSGMDRRKANGSIWDGRDEF